MPETQKGSWFLHYREKMDANLIEGIKGLLYEIWHTRERIKRMKEEGREPPKYLRKYFGNPMKHSEKYLLINQAFAGKQRLMPFFNRQNNEDLNSGHTDGWGQQGTEWLPEAEGRGEAG